MTACPKCSHDPSAQVLALWTFHIPRAVKSGNAHVHNAGGSRWAYKAERETWRAFIGCYALKHGIPRATTKRRVTLTRCFGKGQRAFDRDNLATGCKPIVDAMVRAGLLTNDDAKGVEIHYEQRRAEPVGLGVLIEEVAA